MSILFVSAYFKDTIGFVGPNVDLVNKLCQPTNYELAEATILMADFNMTLDELENTPVPQLFGFTVLHKGLGQGTCRISKPGTDDKVLDYLLCSESVKHLITDLGIVYDVPWWPHYGIQFNVRRDVYHHMATTVKTPKSLPLQLSEKGRPCVNQMSIETYDSIFRNADIDKEAHMFLQQNNRNM